MLHYTNNKHNMNNSVYILNPAYFLRNDVHRAVIGTYDHPEMPSEMYDRNIHFLIHPITAQMLSFFDGTRNLQENLELISDFFDIDFSDCEKIIEKYINNPDTLYIKFEDDYILLPKMVLIECYEVKRTEYYTPKEFEVNGDIDLKTTRLYKPLKAIIELNFSCYTDCCYCYADRKNTKSKELVPTEKILDFIEEIHKERIPSIEVNGGEVLMHPNIREILLKMSQFGYHPFISTKIPLSEEQLCFLKSIGIKNIQISIDSLNEDVLIKTLKVKNGYLHRLMQTMDMLDEMRFNWQVNVVLHKLNVSIDCELSPLLTFLSKYKKLVSIKINPLGYSMYKDSQMFYDFKASIEDIENAKIFVDKFAQEIKHIDFVFAEYICQSDYKQTNKLDKFPRRSICSANQKGFVVLPNGEVTICEELYWNPYFIIGDITKQTIRDIWNSEKAKSLFFIDQNIISAQSVCKTCKTFMECRHHQGVCWKMVVMAYGANSWDYPDPLCPSAPFPDTRYCY